MILSFEFQYISQNRVLENFLKTICEEFDIVYKIDKKATIVTLYVDGDEQKLGDFADFLSNRLPLSIFFKSSSVNIVETIESYIQVAECELTLPYTPKALLSAQDKQSCKYMNPFIKNEVGNSPFADSQSLFLLDAKANPLFSANESEQFIALYEKISELLKSNKKVLIESPSGHFIYSQVAHPQSASMLGKFTIIPTDLSVVEKMVVIRDNEIKALASLEKPAIKLKVNSLFASKNILQTNRVKLKLADDLLLQLICQKLFEHGIEFLYRQNIQDTAYDYAVSVDGSFYNIPQIEICVLENGEILIVNGDGYSASSVKENLKKFDDVAFAQFTSIIQEHDIFKEEVNCFYLSKTHDDKIMYISEDSGMMELVHFPIIRSFEEIFSTIKSSSTGEKLLENYEKQFPQIYKIALQTQIPQNAPDNIYTMWGICSVILGLSEDIAKGAEIMIELAEDYGGQKGPRIDYPMVTPEALISNFNFIKMVRSSMSFKLANTDDTTLSFGFLESLAYFLSDCSDYYRENLQSKRMLLCGSMFGIRRLSELTCRNIKAGNKLAFNRELPIDN